MEWTTETIIGEVHDTHPILPPNGYRKNLPDDLCKKIKNNVSRLIADVSERCNIEIEEHKAEFIDYIEKVLVDNFPIADFSNCTITLFWGQSVSVKIPIGKHRDGGVDIDLRDKTYQSVGVFKQLWRDFQSIVNSFIKLGGEALDVFRDLLFHSCKAALWFVSKLFIEFVTKCEHMWKQRYDESLLDRCRDLLIRILLWWKPDIPFEALKKMSIGKIVEEIFATLESWANEAVESLWRKCKSYLINNAWFQNLVTAVKYVYTMPGWFE